VGRHDNRVVREIYLPAWKLGSLKFLRKTNKVVLDFDEGVYPVRCWSTRIKSCTLSASVMAGAAAAGIGDDDVVVMATRYSPSCCPRITGSLVKSGSIHCITCRRMSVPPLYHRLHADDRLLHRFSLFFSKIIQPRRRNRSILVFLQVLASKTPKKTVCTVSYVFSSSSSFVLPNNCGQTVQKFQRWPSFLFPSLAVKTKLYIQLIRRLCSSHVFYCFAIRKSCIT